MSLNILTLASLENASFKVTGGAAAVAVTVWGLQLSDWAVIVSASIAVLGFIVHITVHWRREKRAAELHRAQLEALKHETKARWAALARQNTEAYSDASDEGGWQSAGSRTRTKNKRARGSAPRKKGNRKRVLQKTR